MLKPSNPFTLPELAENETGFPPSILKSACTLAAHYIAARERGDVEATESFDGDIGALLSEEFDMNQYNERGLFRARFMVMIHDCNAAFGRLDYQHSHWAYDTSRV
ncbi:hypothetical protein [Pseudomonas sp. DP16D-R1]|jgi:hypothetical protein|uniref:hypothetical protein n=1 Tax=Pseudomonas sp. DP16D-R1 TaxID=2075551 RepID=UPI000CCFF89D|nr:hypothetical protein [Pseudomonas sp. DP16D-R1]POA78612.1 hypothetical protein C1890_09765 [Pseudomonas sp. DP16D-R1]